MACNAITFDKKPTKKEFTLGIYVLSFTYQFLFIIILGLKINSTWTNLAISFSFKRLDLSVTHLCKHLVLKHFTIVPN